MPSEDERSAAPPPPLLTESPNSVATERTDSPEQQEEEEESSSSSPSSADSSSRQFTIVPKSQQSKASPSSTLHPYTRPLTISDLDSCVALENAAFTNPEERATREKASRGKTKFPRTPYLTCVSLGAHVLIHRTGSQLSVFLFSGPVFLSSCTNHLPVPIQTHPMRRDLLWTLLHRGPG